MLAIVYPECRVSAVDYTTHVSAPRREGSRSMLFSSHAVAGVGVVWGRVSGGGAGRHLHFPPLTRHQICRHTPQRASSLYCENVQLSFASVCREHDDRSNLTRVIKVFPIYYKKALDFPKH